MSDEPVAAPEKPSRYDRSFGGLIAAMLVTVLLVAAYVGFRALLREQPNGRPDPVDYFSDVRGLQESGVAVVYPSDLPVGWVPTSVDYQRGDQPLWSIGIVTAQDKFVGIVEQKGTLGSLLESYVDPHYDHGPDTRVESAFGDTWQSWSDSGGDHGLSIVLGSRAGSAAGDNLLVYGSASLEQQEELVQLLTTSTLPARSPSDPITESQ